MHKRNTEFELNSHVKVGYGDLFHLVGDPGLRVCESVNMRRPPLYLASGKCSMTSPVSCRPCDALCKILEFPWHVAPPRDRFCTTLARADPRGYVCGRRGSGVFAEGFARFPDCSNLEISSLGDVCV